MKAKIFTLFIVCTALFVACTPRPKNPGTGIQYFTGNLDQAMAEASKQHKPIFIYCHTDWCGYCRKMEKSTLLEKEVSDYMNANYINLTYDMEKGEGTFIASKYGIQSFPAYIILEKDGSVREVGLGYLKTENFLAFVKK